MDLSQQELPLTAHFTRGGKELRPRTVHRKTARSVGVSQSAARSPKRKRTKESCAAANSSTGRAGSSKPCPTTLQLPTPAASARKRVYSGQLPETTRAALTGLSLSSEPNTLSSKKDLAQSASVSVPSKPHRSLRDHAENAVSGEILATLSTDRARTTEPIVMVVSPRCRPSSDAVTCVITPQTLSRRAPKVMHDIHDHTPLACHSPPKPSQVSSISSCSPVAVDCYDPFHVHEQNSRPLLPREDTSPSLEWRFVQLETSNGQASHDPLVPAIPVSSSQSQYLLHPDATPKHKRYSRCMDHVVTSQTQEEVELMLATSHNLAATVNLLARRSPVNSKQKDQYSYTLPSIPIGSAINSPDSSRYSAKRKASDELPFKLSSPSRRNTLTPSQPPNYKSQRKTLRSPTHHESTKNTSPVHIEEDSSTEPESELDILQAPPRLPVPKNACTTIRCGLAQDNSPSTEDDSATEAESDTEFHKCLAEIGRKPLVMHHSEVSKEHTPPPPIISPLVSPTRPIVAGPPSLDFPQFSTQEGAGLSVPGSCMPFASVLEQIQARPESLPSIVRDFVHMFPGDESYPADFPESLRV